MPNKTLEALGLITDILLKANVAAPFISGLIMAIASIIKGVVGHGPPLSEIADMLEQKIGRTDANIRAEIERLKALVNPPTPGA